MSTNFQLRQAATAGDTFSDSVALDVLMNIIGGPSNRAILAGFSVAANGVPTPTSKMRIASNGVSVAGVLSGSSVGVGTLTPQSALDVVGSVSVSSNISVRGVTSLGSNLNITNGNLNITGSLNVTGQILQGGSNLVAAGTGTGTGTGTGSNIFCKTLQVTDTLTLGSNAVSFTNGSGNSITAQTWNYMQQYVFPSGVTPTVTRTLFGGVAQSHSAYVQNGAVYAFGLNNYGQLGLGDLVSRKLPTVVPGLSGALAVACGQGFTVVLLTNGSAVAFGYNGNGMLGDGTTTSRLVPTPVLGVSTATSVTAGFFHTLFLLAGGAVVGYGSSSNGQLGAGTTAVINTALVSATLPTPTAGAAAGSFVCRAIDAGAYHSVMLLVNGTAYSFGQNTYAQLGQGNTAAAQLTVPTLIAQGSTLVNVVNVGAGQYHTLLVLYDGTVLSCGRNDAGQCGVGTTTSPQPSWSAVVNPPGAANPSAGLATYVAAGTAHTVILKADGSVWVCGSNAMGQLGAGAAVAGYTTPTQLRMSYAVYTAFSVAAGANHTVILLNNDVTVAQKNRIVAFGDNSSGQVGTSLPNVTTAYTPFPIFDGAMVYNKRLMAPSSSCYLSAYVDVDGTVYSWGANDHGNLGDGTTMIRPVPSPMSFFNFSNGRTRIMSICAGVGHSAALDSAGNVYTWGVNTLGQLGNNSTTDTTVPQSIASMGSLAGVTITSMMLGGSHCVALDSSGSMHAWGKGASGQLGSGSTTDSHLPMNVSGQGSLQGKTVVTITAGETSTGAIDASGNIHVWGWNRLISQNQLVPLAYSVGSLNGLAAQTISMGTWYTVVIDSLSQLHAWGWNQYGQVGDGTTTDRGNPVCISNISGSSLIGKTIVAVSCGDCHTLALDSTGSVHAWGANNAGQLGIYAGTNQSLPLNISGCGSLVGKTVLAITAGVSHSMALESTGGIHVWGNGANGQNGNNTTSNLPVPTLVTLNSRNLNPPMFSHGGLGDNKLLKGRNADLGILLSVGANTYGQVGDGTTTTRPNLVALATLGSAVISCASGVNHSGAITANGGAYLWGRNNLGQCSTANSNNILVPTPVSPVITNAASVCCGTGCSFITLADGSVVGLGDNTSNQLGVPTIASASNATVVGGLANVAQLSSGGGASLALTSAGAVYSWGNNVLGATGQGTLLGTTSTPTLVNPTPWNSQAVTRISSGNGVSALVTANGSCYTCGANVEGALGQPTNFGTGCVSTFAMVADPISSYLTGFGNAVVDAKCGPRHTVLLLANNTVRAFGQNTAGQLNGAVGPNQWQPLAPLQSVNFNPVVAIAASAHTTLKEYADRTTTATGVVTSTQTRLMTNSTNGSGSYLITPKGQVYGWGSIMGNNNLVPYLLATWGSLATVFVMCVSTGCDAYIFCDSQGQVHTAGVTNQFGQLGNGTTNGINPPSNVSFVVGSSLAGVFVTLVCMSRHAVALDAAGSVHTWGLNSSGQLGNGGTANASTLPAQIMATPGSSLLGKRIVAVCVGGYHTMALDSAGCVHSWGSNDVGQLGNNTTANQLLPIMISSNTANSICGLQITAICASEKNSMALDSSGCVHVWGLNNSGQLGMGDTADRRVTTSLLNVGTLSGRKVMAISCGAFNSAALDSTFVLHQWGSNVNGELGNGSTTNQLIPISPMGGALAGKRIVAISCANFNVMAMDASGLIFTWGSNTQGQVGNTGTVSPQASPVQVSNNYVITQAMTAGVSVVSTAGRATTLMIGGGAGLRSSFLITPLGVVHDWGLINGSQVPVSLAAFGSLAGVFVTCVAGGTSGGVLMCDSSGGVHAFGANNYGELGVGYANNNAVSPATAISAVAGSSLNGAVIVSVQMGLIHSIALDANGAVHAWGSNQDGQLGSTSAGLLPMQIMATAGSSLTGTKIAGISAGRRHNLAVDSNGRVHSWGSNSNGQLGNGTASAGSNTTPTMISGVTGSSLNGRFVAVVAAGYFSSMALDSTGSVHMWGSGGQMGNNTTADSYIPSNISTFGSLSGKTVVSIALGGDFCMALDSTGQVHMWGQGAYGQLGQGNTAASLVPVPTPASSRGKVVSIAAGLSHALTCDATGLVATVGLNDVGQLGIGNLTNQMAFTQVSGLFGSLSSFVTTVPTTAVSFTPFFVSFTGQHRVFVAGETTVSLGTKEGFIVVCDQEEYITASGSAPLGKFSRGLDAITVNDSLPVVSLSKAAYDRRVLGVLSSTVFPLYPTMSPTEQQTQRLVEVGDIRMECNAIGAGAIWVSDVTGSISSGDLITSSSIPGYGMLQADPMPHVFQCFTVAKATCSCDFTAPQQPVLRVQVDADGLNVLDASGAPLWSPVTCTVRVDPSTGVIVTEVQQQQMTPEQVQALRVETVAQTEPKYQMRWLQADGTLISQAAYESSSSSPRTVFRAAFIGCTYHCG